MAVTWHVDHLKVSHKDPFKVAKFTCYFQSIYGKNLTAKRDTMGMHPRNVLEISWGFISVGVPCPYSHSTDHG